MRKEKTTLKTIAAETGYSINTVSRALKDMPDVTLKTRTLIKKKAEELGYIGNILASSMRSGLTNTVAVILSDIANPHFAILVEEIVENLQRYGYTAFVMTSNEDASLENQALKAALSRNVDGIIMCPTQQSTENVVFLENAGVPFVLIGRYFPDMDTNYVVCNDVMGGYQATRYLINLGHRNILFLNGDTCISSAAERQAGYEKALEEAGILEKNVRNIPVRGRFASYFEAIFAGTVDFTAIIAFSDMLAWELLDYLTACGYHVPSDMSVIAFDDLQSRYVLPFQLSSVVSHKRKMSYIASDVLIRKIKNPDEETKKIILPTMVMQRGSCCAPKRKQDTVRTGNTDE